MENGLDLDALEKQLDLPPLDAQDAVRMYRCEWRQDVGPEVYKKMANEYNAVASLTGAKIRFTEDGMRELVNSLSPEDWARSMDESYDFTPMDAVLELIEQVF